jgi:hypothetical protein
MVDIGNPGSIFCRDRQCRQARGFASTAPRFWRLARAAFGMACVTLVAMAVIDGGHSAAAAERHRGDGADDDERNAERHRGDGADDDERNNTQRFFDLRPTQPTNDEIIALPVDQNSKFPPDGPPVPPGPPALLDANFWERIGIGAPFVRTPAIRIPTGGPTSEGSWRPAGVTGAAAPPRAT